MEKQPKKEYLKKYYEINKEKWKKGNCYHPKSNKTDIKGFKIVKEKVVISFN